MCVYMYICIYVHVHTHIYIYVHNLFCAYMCIDLFSLCVCVFVSCAVVELNQQRGKYIT